MLWLSVFVAIVGLASCQEEAEPVTPIVAREWDCSQDHRPHPTDPRKFQQSAGQFAEGADIFENTCPSKLQVFNQSPEGLCRCLYREELRALLLEECQIRVPANAEVGVYELLVPSLNVDTIEELYVRQNCDAVLPANVRAYYSGLNIIPLFFNSTACACQMTPEALAAPPPPIGEGDRCERLVDLDLNSPQIGSDFVGNWFSVFPFGRQNNATNTRGGAAFGGNEIISAATWRLAATSFVEMNLVARFQADGSGGDMVIFSNECADNPGGEGSVTVLYNPSGSRYTVRFFSQQSASCSAGGTGVQGIQLYYNRTSVRLTVNGVNCDISSLNPISDPATDGRIAFNSACPMQLGGRVLSNVFQADYGQPDASANSLSGSFISFLALRNCDNPPLSVVNRIQGIAQ